jgi:hypothetical protein
MYRVLAVWVPTVLRLPLLDTKFLDIRIKYELFARDKRDLQESSVTFMSLPRNAVNKGVVF